MDEQRDADRAPERDVDRTTEQEAGPAPEQDVDRAPEPRRPEPPRSPWAAALLNLTGLPLGYAYLRDKWRTGLYLAGAALLVTLAFATGASAVPWLWQAVAAIWLVWTAVDAGRLASRGPRAEGRERAVPIAVAGVLIAAVVTGYVLYLFAGERAYAAGVQAQSRADCVQAGSQFSLVSGVYELTLSPNVQAADVRASQCSQFEAAAAERRSGEFADAVSRYRDFRRTYPGTELVPYVTAALHSTFADWGQARRAAGDPTEAISVYRDALTEPDAPAATRSMLAATYLERAAAARTGPPELAQVQAAVDDLLVVAREFADTASAAEVPQAVVDTYTAASVAVREQRFCDALPTLDYFVTLPPAETAGVVATANADRARSMFECGLANYRSGDAAAALDVLEPFVAAYPADPGVLQARSAVVAATIGEAKGGPLPPLPGPLSGDSVGPIPYTIYNDSPYEVRVLLNGPTTHELLIPPCPDCRSGYAVEPVECPTRPGLPSVTVRLRAGVYDDLAYSPARPEITEHVDTNDFRSNFEYSACYFSVLGG